jgi:hypothetical protein
MKDSTKRILLIGGSLLVVGGVIYYFITRGKGDNEDNTNNETAPPQDVLTDQVIASSSTSNTPSELNTPAKIKAFQDWMDTIGPWVKGADGKYRLLNKGAGYGTFGPSTSAAWSFYKSAYLAPAINDEVTISGNSNLKKAIDYLLSIWSGDKTAFKNRLSKEPTDFVIKWANSVKDYKAGNLVKGGFEYKGRIYDVIWGKQRISVNPIGKTAKAFKDTTLRQTPSASALKTSVFKGSNFDKVSDYRWNANENLMYLFVPNNGTSTNNKWTFLGNVTLN